jgi:uncharacterized FlgJ-related protein
MTKEEHQERTKLICKKYSKEGISEEEQRQLDVLQKKWDVIQKEFNNKFISALD